MKKRVLILSTSAGSGHKTAATALEKAFRQSAQVEEVVNKDALEYTNQGFKALYSDLFAELVKKNPIFLGWWYEESDQPWRTDDMRLLIDRLNAEPLIKFIKEFRPDITVCTHFMPAGIIARLMTKGDLHTTLSIVTTDFDFHSMWLSRVFNRYFVAIDETKAHLETLGMPKERITVSGIPVDPLFSEPVDKQKILDKYQLQADKPIIIVSAGSAGDNRLKYIVQRVMQLHTDTQTIIVCGNNRQLRSDIEVLVMEQAAKFRVLGYTSDMASLMKIATLFVGKPGGLTISEAMAASLPVVIVWPIPGQEERNSDHLLERGAAIRCNDITVVTHKLDKLLNDPQRLKQMRENAHSLGRPDAAQKIVETLLSEKFITPVYLSKTDQERMVEAVKFE
ncbi:MAG: glycosyltransferase [Chloroflexi bacterium AL-W]|nr:glycosyltransferase [Chloroflexi bacterium AL-N1]NOK64843.1 glycosyltransferase [Chloroflexi bacterium AL-N10]NOK76613.1 glycosyltransferase [Chloroflexi bacterium AL-N5]NOK80158.1 glycosyltransferase [Chloroflexi bacterium AL-W]NOK86671.1 glycosyltransferase [Chloroflexi bacterium AL-N15]